jgi:hypothetical protein
VARDRAAVRNRRIDRDPVMAEIIEEMSDDGLR